MTTKIGHKETGIIKINGGHQVVWKFNNQIFHIGFIGELEEIESYKVLFDNAMTMLLAEKDAEIERLKEEETILTKFNEMCEESLSPDVIHSWGIVKFWIKKNRHLGEK